ncbi:MAG: ribonucleotide reductase subunit alpha [Burkholderiaceae bacterium]
MTIASFDDLLRAAIEQPEPQRLLFVFATAGVDADATAAQKARFAAGQGGTLTPMMCVDKLPRELASFDALLEESREFDQAWDMVFVAALAGSDGISPSSVQAEAPLQRMVDAIKSGSIDGFIPFDAQGRPVQFG